MGNGIFITDHSSSKCIIFEKNGSLSKELDLPSSFQEVFPLKNGNFLIKESADVSDEFFRYILYLYSPDLKKIKELDNQNIPNPSVKESMKGIYYMLCKSISKNKIFTGFQERDYEIYVYDFGGNLLNKIRKEYKKAPVTEEYKKKYMEQFSAPFFNSIRKKIYFPDVLPPFHSFFSDDEDRLFVMTYEKDKNEEYIYDIFDSEGNIISRRGLKIFHNESGVYAKIKNNQLYCLEEKKEGFRKLVIYKTVWS
jgi:hypothetical protein